MRFFLVLVAIGATVSLTPNAAKGAIVWSGPPITISKIANADWTLAANQDRLGADVWLTRASTSGLFNIKSETAYVKNVSPAGTEWAYGTTASYQSLVFKDWETWNGKAPASSIGQNAVVHLIAADTYIDIKVLTWGSVGGEFSYVRSTLPEPSAMVLLMVGVVGILGRRSRS